MVLIVRWYDGKSETSLFAPVIREVSPLKCNQWLQRRMTYRHMLWHPPKANQRNLHTPMCGADGRPDE